MTPDREVITFIPEEFIVDGFQGIRDPRGMMGVRLENAWFALHRSTYYSSQFTQDS